MLDLAGPLRVPAEQVYHHGAGAGQKAEQLTHTNHKGLVTTWPDAHLRTYIHRFTYMICKTIAFVSFAQQKNVQG